ncbi:efflux RND transporter permease subunit [Sediminitomix flava]|uniref:Cu(I)/Ag(I) efflux system membrane protein CusA/SilA n=1 Tax=Sediminitomix flava TaxID=379075 RepID=A0A315Z9A0_SEDFL|nr:efflux RND transporter permease subunit [Sediminitomix flava]PWJ40989.1 Cu(I)/Ag(I) efflux system membrane protein CusA/SilA [Sediminitomix flava]
MLNHIIKFFLSNRLITALMTLAFLFWGIAVAPFDFGLDFIPKSPVSVDAIPDIGENQQIVMTEWMGRSPQDIEDQISYPLTTALMGIPGVKTIRSSSMFGLSSIYIIFDEEVDFYWSRSRILEKLNALPPNTLPKEVQPTLGPDATGLGQIFWYTLEGRDQDDNPTGGWDLQELRSVQDYYVKYGLMSAEGVSEVASIGGYIKEYQIDLRPEAMKAFGVSLPQIVQAVRNSNLDVGAKTIEINRAEYFVRGLGYVKKLEDLESAVIAVNQNTPIRIKDIAKVSLGPATRRGALDKSGAEVVGGVVVARYNSNPMAVIGNVKAKIKELEKGLPAKTLADGTTSQLKIITSYDRSGLIQETLSTLKEAISLEILVTLIVIVVMVYNLRSSLLISALLPLGVLMTFIAMKAFNITANIVSLSGIAIAIGTMVDVGIVLTENLLKHLKIKKAEDSIFDTVYNASTEVGSAIVTAVATTIVSFIPVFSLQAAEGKLFSPLAFTKTFALLSAVIIALCIIPTFSLWVFRNYKSDQSSQSDSDKKSSWKIYSKISINVLFVGAVAWWLSKAWMPLGFDTHIFWNFLFTAILLGLVLGGFQLFQKFYPKLLTWALAHKLTFLSLPIATIFFGGVAWTKLGSEFMPALNEGSFLLMPTSMPHAGFAENLDVLRMLDIRVTGIPEVENVLGKMGRANSALDPAPISMYENIINYKTEYVLDEDGNPQRFKVNSDGEFIILDQHQKEVSLKENERLLIDTKRLIPDTDGAYFRQWREHILSPDDIWAEIVKATKLPGVTSAPKLQPIETRLVMLQTGMRAPMGIKVKGPDLATIEAFGFELEKYLKEVPSVKTEAVFADRMVGKPYLEININRQKIARYGLSVQAVQMAIETSVGGMTIENTVEGRERYPIRVRYPRELRDSPDKIGQILISTPTGIQIPLEEVAELEYTQGAQMIKSEDTFLVGYVLFDRKDGFAEGEVVSEAQAFIQEKIDSGELKVPSGVSYRFSGNYENQVRAEQRLSIVVPIVLLVIFLILYLQFRSIPTTFMVFSGIAVAFAGGFLMLWAYSWSGFMNIELFNIDFRNLFQIHEINLSVAVWVGFIALFGIATDDGVLIATYLTQNFEKEKPTSVDQIRQTVLESGMRRVRPALMTSATTLLALLPVLTSTGKGSDIMIPMAIPSFGGMTIALMTLFVVPVLYSAWEELKLKRLKKDN